MTEHPITPPPELVQQWSNAAHKLDGPFSYTRSIANQSARWGADMELEACCDFLQELLTPSEWITGLRTARRPKPPSLKEQALDALREAESSGCLYVNGRSDTIRRALEALPD